MNRHPLYYHTIWMSSAHRPIIVRERGSRRQGENLLHRFHFVSNSRPTTNRATPTKKTHDRADDSIICHPNSLVIRRREQYRNLRGELSDATKNNLQSSNHRHRPITTKLDAVPGRIQQRQIAIRESHPTASAVLISVFVEQVANLLQCSHRNMDPAINTDNRRVFHNVNSQLQPVRSKTKLIAGTRHIVNRPTITNERQPRDNVIKPAQLFFNARPCLNLHVVHRNQSATLLYHQNFRRDTFYSRSTSAVNNNTSVPASRHAPLFRPAFIVQHLSRNSSAVHPASDATCGKKHPDALPRRTTIPSTPIRNDVGSSTGRKGPRTEISILISSSSTSVTG